MRQTEWNLTGIRSGGPEVFHQEVRGPLGFEYQQLQDGKRRGVEIVTLTCGECQVQIVPTRGMGIASASVADTTFGWDSPVRGPVHPSLVPVLDPGGLGWLEGFDELLVRCGLVSNGAPEFDEEWRLRYPLHGRIANLPAEDVVIRFEEETGIAEIRGTVTEQRFHFHRLKMESVLRMRLGEPGFGIVDRVVNESSRPAGIQLLYHLNLGPPVLGAGSRVVAPALRVAARDSHAAEGIENWDQFSGPDAAYREEVYFAEMATDRANETAAALIGPSSDVAVSVAWNTRVLPCFTLWKNTVDLADGYVTGLEPGTNFPNCRSFEELHGRVLELPPGGSVDFEVHVGFHIGASQVDRLVEQIGKLHPGKTNLIRSVSSPWSPGEK